MFGMFPVHSRYPGPPPSFLSAWREAAFLSNSIMIVLLSHTQFQLTGLRKSTPSKIVKLIVKQWVDNFLGNLSFETPLMINTLCETNVSPSADDGAKLHVPGAAGHRVTLNPASYILHPTPYTLHPQPYTLHPTPHTRRPSPYALNPTPYTPHPTPYTLHPARVQGNPQP
jgi:hypothetical protein